VQGLFAQLIQIRTVECVRKPVIKAVNDPQLTAVITERIGDQLSRDGKAVVIVAIQKVVVQFLVHKPQKRRLFGRVRLG